MSARAKALVLAISLLVPMASLPSLAAPADSPRSPEDAATRARARFLRGVELYEERDFGGAAVEFRQAYEMVPSFRILFNLGRVAVELHDYAGAIDLFTRYLSEGGDQIASDRRRDVQEEILRLRPRVAQIKLETDEIDAEILLDDVLVGRTPMPPLTVNVGRRRLELRPRRGPSEIRVVDAPGQETVVLRFAHLSPGPLPLPPAEPAPGAMVRTSSLPGVSRPSAALWMGWTMTALCAAGAAVFGVMAYQAANDLRNLRDSYPVTRAQLDSQQKTTRTLSLVADGLLAGAVVFGGLSIYLTVDRQPHEANRTVGVGLARHF